MYNIIIQNFIKGMIYLATLIDYKSFSPILQEYASYKLAIQGCSQKTVDEYMLDLRTFFRFVIATKQNIDPNSEDFLNIDIHIIDLEFIKSIKTEDVYSFLMYTGTTRKNMWSAKARKLSAIKTLYKYLVNKRCLMDNNPVANIESPKPKKTLPKVLTLEESLSLLNAVKNDKESKTTVRDYTIITLFLNCGMRVSELTGINLSDIDSQMRSLRVIGKGSKERIIYLNSACISALSEYIEIRKNSKYEKLNERALFLSKQYKRISVKTVQWLVYKYLDMAGLESKHYSVHKLRHTAATLMYQSGEVDVRVLKDILGHEQLNTTQIYTHVSDAQMENAMEQNPLSKIKK